MSLSSLFMPFTLLNACSCFCFSPTHPPASRCLFVLLCTGEVLQPEHRRASFKRPYLNVANNFSTWRRNLTTKHRIVSVWKPNLTKQNIVLSDVLIFIKYAIKVVCWRHSVALINCTVQHSQVTLTEIHNGRGDRQSYWKSNTQSNIWLDGEIFQGSGLISTFK